MKLSQAKKYLPFVQAAAEGKTIQYLASMGIENWKDIGSNEDDWYFDNLKYRIKPTPTLRPWKPEEVPVGALIRSKYRSHPNSSWLILGSAANIYINQKEFKHDVALEQWEHSLDHGKTWLPCGVEEV